MDFHGPDRKRDIAWWLTESGKFDGAYQRYINHHGVRATVAELKSDVFASVLECEAIANVRNPRSWGLTLIYRRVMDRVRGEVRDRKLKERLEEEKRRASSVDDRSAEFNHRFLKTFRSEYPEHERLLNLILAGTSRQEMANSLGLELGSLIWKLTMLRVDARGVRDRLKSEEEG